MLKPVARLVFLLDVDNTLFDNDGFANDLHTRLTRDFGDAGAAQYRAIYEKRREALGYADYLGSLQEFRDLHPGSQTLLGLSSFLLDYPFAAHLLPQAREVIAHLDRFGPTVILSDGDAVFQPRKVANSGLSAAVQGRVLIYLHKQQALADLQRQYPAEHYVMVDDKPSLLAAVKAQLADRVTTVFVRQGHYAEDAVAAGAIEGADITIGALGELLQWPDPPFSDLQPG